MQENKRVSGYENKRVSGYLMHDLMSHFSFDQPPLSTDSRWKVIDFLDISR